MATTETTNRQYRLFDARHDSGYCSKYGQTADRPGLTLNDAKQPVVRVSWLRARDYCRWLSKKTGMEFTLPTEAQWEYACRAGTGTALHFGTTRADFSRFANLADKSLAGKTPFGDKSLIWTAVGWSLGPPCRIDVRDGAVVTTAVGRYQPNAWGLHDMHGNAAEWTRTDDIASARSANETPDSFRKQRRSTGRKVVKGGSWSDLPHRAASGPRIGYPSWQRIHNVGFRVVAEAK